MGSELCACGKQKTVSVAKPGIVYCDHCDRACHYGSNCERCRTYNAANR